MAKQWLTIGSLVTTALMAINDTFELSRAWIIFSLILFLYLLYAYIYYASIQFKITAEQIIYERGIIIGQTDYLELYRVIDYQQKSNIIEQILHLKTVIVFSGDRNTPILQMYGILRNQKIIEELRNRVEINKIRRGVYEITNR